MSDTTPEQGVLACANCARHGEQARKLLSSLLQFLTPASRLEFLPLPSPDDGMLPINQIDLFLTKFLLVVALIVATEPVQSYTQLCNLLNFTPFLGSEFLPFSIVAA